MAASSSTRAQEEPIVVSYQPNLYWSLPFFIASEKGWWKEVGLAPTFVTFPAGAPQIAAVPSKSWDVGGTGAIPAVLGAVSYGVETIGIGADESLVDQLMVRASKYEEFKKNPSLIKGQKILMTANSTGDYVVTSCLSKYGLSKADVQVVNMGQAQIISAMSSGNGDLAGVWEPNNSLLEENAGAVKLCSGKDAGAVVLAVLVARGDYAKQHPTRVVKFLATYLKAIKWMKANPDGSRTFLRQFMSKGGVTLTDKSLKSQVEGNVTFDLDQQLKAFARPDPTQSSALDNWMNRMSEFMKSVGSIRMSPKASEYVTDKYLKAVQSDPRLNAFAEGSSR